MMRKNKKKNSILDKYIYSLYVWVVHQEHLWVFLLSLKYPSINYRDMVGFIDSNEKNSTRIFRIGENDFLKILTVISGFEDADSKIDIVRKGSTCKVCAPAYWKRQKEKIYKCEEPAIYIVEIEQADIIGGDRYYIHNNSIIDDAIASDIEKHNFYGPTILSTIKKCAILQYQDFNKNVSKAIYLGGIAANNYYHFTVEIISRLSNVDQYEKYRNWPIIIDEAVSEIPQLCELLNIINQYDHRVIWIKRMELYHIGHLVFPSYQTWMPINSKKRIIDYTNYRVSDLAVSNIRKCIFEKYKFDKKKGSRKIFISRKNVDNSRLVNEEQVVREFLRYGFEIIYPEEMCFEEQARTFHEAAYIAGASGAAMTNVLYAHEGAMLVCIVPEEDMFYGFSTLATLAGAKTMFLDPKIVKRSKYISQDKWKLNIDYLDDFLKSMMGKKE